MSILQHAAEVLRCYGAGYSSLTVTEVSERLAMPKASASRLLRAMREAGMLETIGNSRQHRPGRMMLDLAGAFRHSSGLIARASEIVLALVRRFGHTGYVSLRNGREVSAVADFEGTNSLRVVSSVGRRLQADRSATGRTLLARLADSEIRALYAGQRETDALLARMAEVRARGFDFSREESTPGVDALAIAVADPAADELVALCLVYPHALATDAEREAMLTAMAEGAAGLAAAMRDTAFTQPDLRALAPLEETVP